MRATVDAVHRRYVAAGYRPPRRDGTRGGNHKTDIYIRDVGAQGLYGFCTTEKRFRPNGPFDAWAYCVLDNDYRRGQFPALTPLENMQVTAAHEYFHAVQFAYDAFEDSWFMEATATWAEDEIFDDINDNLQYLRRGPLRRPQVPLDKFELGGLHQYGDWIFFRYLTEQFPDGPAACRPWSGRCGRGPTARPVPATCTRCRPSAPRWPPGGVVRAAVRPVRRRQPQAGRGVRRGRRQRLPERPAQRQPHPRTAVTAPAGSSRELDHLSSATIRFTPTGLVSPTSRLRVNVDMADTSRGSLAVVTTYPVGELPVASLVSLNRIGVGALTVPFVQGGVSRVEVTLVNASTRTRCWVRALSPFSCFGVPRDDNLTARVRAVATQ